MSSRLSGAGWGGVLFFALATVLFCHLFIPRTVFCILAGVLWGGFKAILIVTIVSMAASIAGFYVGRTVFQGRLQRLFQKSRWFFSLREWSEKGGLSLVFLCRWVGRTNFGLTNLILGSLRMNFRDFFWGTFVTLIPGTIAWVFVGESLGCPILSGTLPTEIQRKLWISTAILTIFGLVPLFYFRRFPRR